MREPTGDECQSSAIVEHGGERYLATWYPQMGGYVGKCLVHLTGEPDSCFDCYVWHDGEFPFSDQNPAHLHHCAAEQFARFGETVAKAQATSDIRHPAQSRPTRRAVVRGGRDYGLSVGGWIDGGEMKKLNGKMLDAMAENYGLRRGPRRWFWPFREGDKSLRIRILAHLLGYRERR